MSSSKITAQLKEQIGKNHGELYQAIYQDFDAWADATIIPGVKNEIRLTSLEINKILKPYSDTFNATEDAIEFKSRWMKIHRGKAELTVKPEEYRATYLAQWQKPGMTRTPEELPFAKYIMEQIIAKIREELNDDTAYNGVFNEAGDSAIDITNGWGTQLKGMITAGEVIPSTLGAINATNALDKIKTLWRGIPPKFKKKANKLTAYMSIETYEALEDHLETLNVNTGRGDEMLSPVYLRGSHQKLQLKPVTWMADSDRIFITPESNLCILTDGTESDLGSIDILQQHYTADLFITFAIAFDFATNMIWCNEAV